MVYGVWCVVCVCVCVCVVCGVWCVCGGANGCVSVGGGSNAMGG